MLQIVFDLDVILHGFILQIVFDLDVILHGFILQIVFGLDVICMASCYKSFIPRSIVKLGNPWYKYYVPQLSEDKLQISNTCVYRNDNTYGLFGWW